MANQDLLKKIEAFIISKKLKHGDKMPREVELAKMFGVSRGALREVIGCLVLKGVLERRTSQGTILRIPDVEEIANDLTFQLKLLNCGKGELKAMRNMLELSLAPSLARYATPYQIDTLSKLNEEMLSLKNNTKEADRRDLKFHKLLFDIPGNRLLKIFSQIMEIQFEGKARPPFASPERVEKSSKEHRKIIEAIKNHNEDELRALLAEHTSQLPE